MARPRAPNCQGAAVAFGKPGKFTRLMYHTHARLSSLLRALDRRKQSLPHPLAPSLDEMRGNKKDFDFFWNLNPAVAGFLVIME